jgi:L-aspartate semialdehyde sulfurtransferase ferredoxin
MITITIDEQACVGCTLCVGFDEARSLPTIVKPVECFGCLACTQECPADAIHHEGVHEAVRYHQNPYAMDLAARISGGINVPAGMDGQGLSKGMADLSVRLLSLGAVLKDTLSTGLPAVGSLAGKTLATQLPRYQVPKDIPEAFELAKRQFAPVWEIQPKLDGDALVVDVKGCFVRDVCKRESCELGGELCVLFGHYLVGYLTALTGLRLRLMKTTRDWGGCSYETKVYR